MTHTPDWSVVGPRLLEALDFYACIDHYPTHYAEAPDVVRLDQGQRARSAIAAAKGERA